MGKRKGRPSKFPDPEAQRSLIEMSKLEKLIDARLDADGFPLTNDGSTALEKKFQQLKAFLRTRHGMREAQIARWRRYFERRAEWV